MSTPFLTDEQLQPICDHYKISLEEGRRRHEVTCAQDDNPDDPICIGCAKRPAELQEFIDLADGGDPLQACLENEGTLNHDNGHFLCNACYISNGMPSRAGGWVTP